MAFDGKSLADGQVAAAKATIYTCPGGTHAYVKHMKFHNTGGGTETLIVYVKRSGSVSRVHFRAVLSTLETAEELAPISLAAGDVIEATTTTATTVDYTLTGAEET